MGERGDRRADRLAADRGGRPLRRRVRGGRRLRPARARPRRRGGARPRATRTPRSRRSRGEVRDRATARVVGITGATGKTTTKDILAALCVAATARTVASEGNYNNELGVPLTLCRLEPDTEVCIVEMGMRGLGQIAWLASFARPDVGADHEHRARCTSSSSRRSQNVARAKAELIEALPPGGIAVVPEEPLLEPYLTRDDIEIRRFGHVDEPGVFRVGEREIRLETSYTARHQLDNTLAALHRLRRARHPRRGRPARRRVLGAARGGARARRRRAADQRLLQREPALDARGARSTSPSAPARGGGSRCSARWPSSGEAAAGVPPRGRRGRARGRRRRADRASARSRASTRRRERRRARYARHGRRGGRRARGAAAPGRRRAREGLARGGTRSGRGETDAADGTRPRRERSSR